MYFDNNHFSIYSHYDKYNNKEAVEAYCVADVPYLRFKTLAEAMAFVQILLDNEEVQYQVSMKKECDCYYVYFAEFSEEYGDWFLTWLSGEEVDTVQANRREAGYTVKQALETAFNAPKEKETEVKD